MATAGQRLLARLCELQWDAVDAEAVARYAAAQAPGSVEADGYETLRVASRFGTLHLRRQVCAHTDGRPHVMPGNDLLPAHHGILITRGLQEQACLLPQDVPFVTAARLLGWRTGEPDILCASTLRTLVRDHGGSLPAEARRQVVGTYAGSGITFEALWSGERLILRGLGDAHLLPLSPQRFYRVEDSEAEVQFSTVRDGLYTSLTFVNPLEPFEPYVATRV